MNGLPFIGPRLCGVFLKVRMKKNLFRRLAVMSAAGAATASQAAAIDVTAVVADIGAQAAPIALVGAAVFLIYVGIKGYKWVRKAL